MSRRRAVAVPTALLVVMLLFALATVMHQQAAVNIRLGQHGERHFKARLLAESATALALDRLNQDPAVEARLLAGFELLEEAPEGRLEARLQPTSNPEVMLLTGRGSLPSRTLESASVFTTIRRQNNDDHLFALDNDNRTLHYLPPGWSDSGAGWQTLPAPPSVSYDDLTTLSTDGHSGHTESMAADLAGRLYVGLRGDHSASVMRFAEDSWTVLPALPDYNLDPHGRIQFDDKPLRHVEQLALDGEVLFVSSGRAVLFGQGLTADSDWQSWKLLPPLPYFDDDEADLDHLQKHFEDLTADAEGNLYVRRHKRVFQLDSRAFLADHPEGVPTSGQVDASLIAYWRQLPSPGDNLDIKGLAATADGRLFVFEKDHHDSAVDRFFTYDASADSWTTHEAGRTEYFDVDRRQSVAAPEFVNHSYRLEELAVGESGKFYLSRHKHDVPLFELSQGTFRTLPELESDHPPKLLTSGGSPAAQTRFRPVETY
ncbi:MAG: hypothetical protein AB7S38_40135 [Vulcanimicrobiota bacterium]